MISQNIYTLIHILDGAIQENINTSLLQGNIIKDHYDEGIDQMRNIIYNSKKWLGDYQTSLIKESGILNLKIKYTNASGYFIEISKAQIVKVPSFFKHKQTLVNASRFTTIELQKFGEELLLGESKLFSREYEIFLEIKENILHEFNDIKKLAQISGYIDFSAGLGLSAYTKNYIRPQVHNKYSMNIVGGKHPVIEENEPNFISNNLSLDAQSFTHIITGPNMGGKSTFLRQNALIVLMSHIGSFVPVEKAEISLVDKIFSRVGASDNLYLGQSTFMVEMQEMAHILHHSTQKSFVIIDEVGRGTSTYDGMSLAWGILKKNHDIIKAKTLFATHYHELIDESVHLGGVDNFSVAVGENEDNIIFLRKIIPGGIKKSYGIAVASLAGIGLDVIENAKKMLYKLEQSNHQGTQLELSHIKRIEPKTDSALEKIKKDFLNIDLNNTTPLQALAILEIYKKELNK